MTRQHLSGITRRSFLKGASVGVGVPVLGGLLAACGSAPQTSTADAQHTNQTTPPPQPNGPATDEMDTMHEAGVKAFVAGVKTEGQGNQPLAPRIENGVKVYELTCKPVSWEYDAGKRADGWAYNSQIPGPELRVTEGDKVRVIVKNELPESTSVHFHGVILPNAMDGVPFVTQPPIKPGASFTYEFTARNAGSHMYHSHHNSTKQVGQGLLGAFIIEPKDKSKEPAYDLDYTMILNDQLGGFTINGKGFPATAPLVATLGQKVRIRYMNEGQLIHPMHLHGLPQLVIAKDGWPQPQPWLCDTLNVAPGERWDVIVDCTEAGVWAFHCHILSHAEGEHGMYGMVTALIIKEPGSAEFAPSGGQGAVAAFANNPFVCQLS
ncbi:MAG TPA: multicopper oxidase domain-containing protein [Roseiflexaceae bacterium]|nr:multicopper oxidase domain-containing protein [Roseiflexaceae bacterium]